MSAMTGRRRGADQRRAVRKRTAKRAVRLDCSGSLDGWRTVTLENEVLKVVVLPEYGGLILDIIYKPRDVNLLWRSPNGVIPRDEPPVVTNPTDEFQARSPGGWPVLFPHGSAPTAVKEATQPFHGEAANRVWRFEPAAAPAGEAAVNMWVDCRLLPLRLERTLRLRASSPVLTVDEKVTNRAGMPIDFMWGHHPFFGKPLMSGDSRIFAPAAKSLDGAFKNCGWPVHNGRDLSRCVPEGAAIEEMFYITDLSEGWYALVNPVEKLGVAMSWDKDVFPYVWIWRESGWADKYPYFGQAYTVALEPFSSLPGARQRGERLLLLEGGRSMETRLTFTAFEGLGQVTGVSRGGIVSGG